MLGVFLLDGLEEASFNILLLFLETTDLLSERNRMLTFRLALYLWLVSNRDIKVSLDQSCINLLDHINLPLCLPDNLKLDLQFAELFAIFGLILRSGFEATSLFVELGNQVFDPLLLFVVGLLSEPVKTLTKNKSAEDK